MKIGFGEDFLGQSTRKYRILAETKDGRFIAKEAPVEMMRPDGSIYYAEPIMGMRIIDNLVDIKEEEEIK